MKCSVKGEIWTVCGGLSWEKLEKPEDLSDFEPDFRAQVRVVPGVIDVLVFPSSVVSLSFVMVFRVTLIGKILYRKKR